MYRARDAAADPMQAADDALRNTSWSQHDKIAQRLLPVFSSQSITGTTRDRLGNVRLVQPGGNMRPTNVQIRCDFERERKFQASSSLEGSNQPWKALTRPRAYLQDWSSAHYDWTAPHTSWADLSMSPCMSILHHGDRPGLLVLALCLHHF